MSIALYEILSACLNVQLKFSIDSINFLTREKKELREKKLHHKPGVTNIPMNFKLPVPKKLSNCNYRFMVTHCKYVAWFKNNFYFRLASLSISIKTSLWFFQSLSETSLTYSSLPPTVKRSRESNQRTYSKGLAKQLKFFNSLELQFTRAEYKYYANLSPTIYQSRKTDS